MKGFPSGSGSRAAATLLALLVLALALRVANGALGSLKLDDFHSLHHARAADLGEFFRVLALDNHPPLSFLLVRGARAAFGEEPWALRLPALAAGLATIALAWRVGARLACPAGRVAGVFLIAASSLHVEISSDLRMYALLALATVGLLDGLLASLEEGRGVARVALWTAVGLHAHYHFLYALAALGAASLWLCLARAPYRARLAAVLAGFALGGLAAAPWYALGFPAQLAHDLPPGGADASGLRMFEGFKNLVFLNASGAGALRPIMLAASALLLALTALGAAGAWRAARASGRVAAPALLAASAFAVPVLGWAAAHASERAGFEWRYLAGSLPAFCLLAGSEACAAGALARARRVAVAAVSACALVLALFNATDPGEEEYRGAARWVLQNARDGDAIVAADWQPRLFPHGIGWSFYSARARAGEVVPAALEHDDAFALVDLEAAAAYPRVFAYLRSLPNGCALLRALRASHPVERVHAFGRSIYVHEFTRE